MELRHQILKCNRCFEPVGQNCRHHEDLLGGYSPGGIVFVGVNPQGADDDEDYRALEGASVEHKMLVGDQILRIFEGAPIPPALAPYRLDREPHTGKQWVRQLADSLGLTFAELVAHVRIVDQFKHTTRDQSELLSGERWKTIRQECPSWLLQQLAVLNPSLVIVSGGLGRQFAAEWLLPANARAALLRTKIEDIHGTTRRGGCRGVGFDVLFTFALSMRTRGHWNNHGRRLSLQEVVRSRLNSGRANVGVPTRSDVPEQGAPAPAEQVIPTLGLDAASVPSNAIAARQYLVESKLQEFEWDSRRSHGVRAAGYKPVRYLHRLELSDEFVEAFANRSSEGGRRYEPGRRWYIANNPQTYWPQVMPRLRPILKNARPRQLTRQEIQAIERQIGDLSGPP